MDPHHIRPSGTSGSLVSVTPDSAGWRFLGFEASALEARGRREVDTGDREVAFVPLSGDVTFHVAGDELRVTRRNVFEELPHILYAPPGTSLVVEAHAPSEVAWGSAPAEGRLPMRLFRPDEMKREVRGGGAATRQVNHVLAPPLPAERLILFEVYVPGGAWSGWPPHCHDGRLGSSYLEETYYYRVRPEAGFAIHRNYLRDEGFDEQFTVRDGDLVLVTKGFHPVAAAPGSSVYFLNFLAGELVGDERATPPVDDPDHAWIKDDWEKGAMRLPLRFENAE